MKTFISILIIGAILVITLIDNNKANGQIITPSIADLEAQIATLEADKVELSTRYNNLAEAVLKRKNKDISDIIGENTKMVNITVNGQEFIKK